MNILTKIAWKNMRKSKIIFLTFLQLTSCFVITLIMISSLSVRLIRYTPIKNYIDSNGVFCVFSTPANKDLNKLELEDYIDHNKIKSKLNKVDDILAVNYPMVRYNSKIPNKYPFNQLSYNDSLIKQYTPELSAGKWLSNSKTADNLEVVISKNNYGWKIGDKIPLLFYNIPKYTTKKATIVGILKENAKIPGNLSVNTIDYNDFYMTYSEEIEEKPILLFNADYLCKNKNIIQGIYSSNIITYKSNITNNEQKSNLKTLTKIGSVFTETNSVVNSNSKNYLYSELYNFLPIIIILFGMIMVSTFSFTALTTRKRLKDYAIFYINGLQWKQCYFINLIQSIYISLISIIITLFILIFISNIFKYQIIFNFLSVSSIIIEMMIFYLISTVMPYILIHRNTPKQILTK